MKLFNVAILSLFSLLTAVAHAQEEAPPPPIEAPADTKEFNQDIDDFEKNMAKEVPGAKTRAAPADKSAEKAHNTIKKQLAKSAKAAKKSKKPVKKAKPAKKPKKKPKHQDSEK